MTLDPISIGTAGYVCGKGPRGVSISLAGYVCIPLGVIQEQPTIQAAGGFSLTARRGLPSKLLIDNNNVVIILIEG